MANKHETIVNNLITDFSVQNRGRLFKNHTGGAWMCNRVDEDYFITDEKNNKNYRIVTLFNARFIKYGLRAKNEKLVDLVGFEFINNVPVWCMVEVKTKSHMRLESHQKDALNMAVNMGGRAYIAREIDSGYELEEWVVK